MYAPVVPSKTIPDSRPKWVKCFQTKKAQKPFPWGNTYLYGLYKGVLALVLTPFIIVRDLKVGEENSI